MSTTLTRPEKQKFYRTLHFQILVAILAGIAPGQFYPALGEASSFAAIGNGSNTIWIDPEHDIVFVWRWYQGGAMDGMVERIIAAVTGIS